MLLSHRLAFLAVCVFVVGIAMAAATGTASAWVWMEADAHPVFRVVLPTVTLWLLFTMVRLARGLHRGDSERPADDWQDPMSSLFAAPRLAPDEVVRSLCPDAEYCQQIRLPAGPGAFWQRERLRARLVRRIGLPHDRHRYVIS